MTDQEYRDVLAAVAMAAKLVVSVGSDTLDAAVHTVGQAIFSAPSTEHVRRLEQQKTILEAALTFGRSVEKARMMGQEALQ